MLLGFCLVMSHWIKPPKPPETAKLQKKVLSPIGKIPDGMTLTPDAGDIRLIFKSSPVYTASVQRRIIRDLTKFRDYLIHLGIPVPKDLPPIGTTETENPIRTISTPPELPTYRGGLTLDKTMVKDRYLITDLYCNYVI